MKLIEQVADLSDGWKTYVEIAYKFRGKVLPEDRDDVESDIILKLKEIKEKYGSRPLTVGGMVLTARFVVLEYWRRKTRESQRFTSLNTVVEHEGEVYELGDTIPDDRAIDLDEQLDQKAIVESLPERAVGIGKALSQGYRIGELPEKDRQYLYRFRHRGRQKGGRICP